jgi:hypothetical protein
MKKNNALLLLLVLLNCCHVLVAQTRNSYTDEILFKTPKSPGANSLINNIITGNDLHTGKLNAAIPIYQYNNNGLSLNLNIEYVSGNGIKVNDVATRYGLGWELTGISSIVREIKDFCT